MSPSRVTDKERSALVELQPIACATCSCHGSLLQPGPHADRWLAKFTWGCASPTQCHAADHRHSHLSPEETRRRDATVDRSVAHPMQDQLNTVRSTFWSIRQMSESSSDARQLGGGLKRCCVGVSYKDGAVQRTPTLQCVHTCDPVPF